MTLTEQWKKGELESGYYFFKTKDNIKIGFLYEGFKYPYDGRYNTIDNAEEVLAPVPSYDHFVELNEMVKENQQLKELLKEWREHLKDTKCGKCQNLIRRTDNAIGEKKCL